MDSNISCLRWWCFGEQFVCICFLALIARSCWFLGAWAQAWMTDRTSFYLTRAFIGACEGGFIPGTILFATYFYKTKELSVRLACFWSTLNVARVISALLAAGILKMRGIGGKPGWFWLFLIEGLLTFLIGFIASSPVHFRCVVLTRC